MCSQHYIFLVRLPAREEAMRLREAHGKEASLGFVKVKNATAISDG